MQIRAECLKGLSYFVNEKEPENYRGYYKIADDGTSMMTADGFALAMVPLDPDTVPKTIRGARIAPASIRAMLDLVRASKPKGAAENTITISTNDAGELTASCMGLFRVLETRKDITFPTVASIIELNAPARDGISMARLTFMFDMLDRVIPALRVVGKAYEADGGPGNLGRAVRFDLSGLRAESPAWFTTGDWKNPALPCIRILAMPGYVAWPPD